MSEQASAAPSDASINNKRLALARQLSRLAGLQGKAVPVYRFEMLEHSRDGASLSDLDFEHQALEMWLARFPTGVWQRFDVSKIHKKMYPLLWVDGQSQQVLLVRGGTASKSLMAEDADGHQKQLSAEQAGQGTLLQLLPQPAEKRHQPKSQPKTAKQWFHFAIRKHRSVFLEAIVATFVISSLALFTALYTMQVYDRVVPTKGFATLWVLTIGVLLSIAFEFAMKQARAHIMDKACKKIDLELSGVFFGKAMDIRMDARPATVGTFASQIRHFESVRNFMTSSTLFVMADAPFALFFVGVIAIIGGPLAIVPMIMIPVTLLVSFISLRKVADISREHMAESNMKNGLLIEAVDGVESIKAAGAEWKMQDRYQNLTATIADSELRMRALSVRSTNLSQSIQQLNYVGLIAVGAHLITSGGLSMGGLIACSIIAGRALGPIAQIPQMVMQWNHAKIALEALDNIMALPSDREYMTRLVVPEQCEGRFLMEKVNFSYTKDSRALNIPLLKFNRGERVAIVGAVGSGKSTLIKLISGLYKPQEGSMFLDGVDMEHLPPEFLREHIGFLPQDVRLFNGTLRDNLTLGLPTPNDTRLMQACALTGLDVVIANHPQGLELMISEGGRGLSGGQRQLVGLTRLLLAKPQVMLLDEPTASMDSQLEKRVMQHLFEEIEKDSLLVVVTHKPALLPHVDRVLVIDKGQISFDGPRDKLMGMMRQNQTVQTKQSVVA